MTLLAHISDSDDAEPDPEDEPRRPIRLLLVDDSPKVLAALLWIFADEPDLIIAATALSAEEALDVCRRASPDVVLMDVRMPGMGGLAAVPYLKQREHPPLVLLLSLEDDFALRHEALRVGADALLLKTELDGNVLRRLIDELTRN
jgi:DNA-binding NarL/FixJ family response regulator